MLDNIIAFNNILVSIEGTLKIEASEASVKEIIDAAVERLENAYGVTFDRDIFTLQAVNQLTADSINLLLKDIKQCLAELSLFISLKLYHKNLGLSLADVNYLGYAKNQLLTALKYLQDKSLSDQHIKEVITPFYTTLNNISMCSVKRLFIIMLMFYRLGIPEGVSIVAQLLYIGGLVA